MDSSLFNINNINNALTTYIFSPIISIYTIEFFHANSQKRFSFFKIVVPLIKFGVSSKGQDGIKISIIVFSY